VSEVVQSISADRWSGETP